ncbi:MAG: hypothetical protein AB7V27_06960 [Candidatus Binatia bacterium]
MRAILIVVFVLVAAFLIANWRMASADTCSDSCDRNYSSCSSGCGKNTNCYTKCVNQKNACLLRCET